MKKLKTISILLIPDDGTSPTVWRLSKFSLYLLEIGLLCFIVLIGLGAISYWKVARVAFQAEAFEERNRRLELQVRKIASLEQTLTEIQAIDEQLRTMLGLGVKDSTAPKMSRSRLLAGAIKSLQGEKHTESRTRPISRFIPSGWPVEGWITAGFEGKSTPSKRRHEGIDIAAQQGSVVKATADGTVSLAGWDDAFGNLVVIDHGGYFVTRYGHNSSMLVQQGDRVRRAQAIALVGNTGRSTAPHLHYEVIEKGQPKDPQRFLLVK